MNNAKLVQVLDPHCDLVGQLLHALLRQGEPLLLNVVEEVFALHEVEHNEVCLTVFEQVDQLDDVLVLTHLQNLNLTTLLEDLNWLHVRFFHRLDGDLGIGNLVVCQFDEAKLTLAECLSKLIEVEQVGEAHRLQQHLRPLLLLVTRVEVEDARLVGWQDDLDGVEQPPSLGTLLFVDLLYEGAGQTVHHTTLRVVCISVAIDLVAVKNSPVLLEPISLRLQVARTLHESCVLVFD